MNITRSTVTLEAGLAIVTVKHYVPIFLDKAATWIENTADDLDRRYGKPYPCTGTFMCMREQVRHKAGCPGRTEKIDRYVRKIQEC